MYISPQRGKRIPSVLHKVDYLLDRLGGIGLVVLVLGLGLALVCCVPLCSAHSLVEGLAQRDGAVLRRVVVVDVEVTLARQLQVQVAVLGHRV